MKCIIFLMKGFFFSKGCFPSVQQLPLLGSTHAVLGRGFFFPEIPPDSLSSKAEIGAQDPRGKRPRGPGIRLFLSQGVQNLRNY